ncbi:MAG TPA: M56 family metallopeptidase [Dyella sp.]|nr:M56 family metallopeptidase [Dyella sp.]
MNSLEALANGWVNHAIRLSWIFTLATALVLAMRRPLRRAVGAEAGPLLWLFVPLALVAALIPHLPASVAALPPVVVRIAGGGTWMAVPAPEGWTVPWRALAMTAWLAGALVVLARVVQAQRRFLRRLAGARAIDVAGAYRPVWLAIDSDLGPAAVGALGVRIVLPADFHTRYTRAEQTLILAHEQVHARRRDGLWRMLAQGLAALFWFHPLAWVALACLRQDQELACDAAVLREHGAPRRDYANAMLKTQASPLMLPVGCSWSSNHPLTERVSMLKQPVPTRTRRLAAHTALGAIVLAGSLGVYAAQPAPAARHPAVADTDHFTVKIDVATRGHAPSMHFTQCLAKGEPFHLSGSDGPGFSWRGWFAVTPAPDGLIQVAGELHVRLDQGGGKVRTMDGKPIVRTGKGQQATIVLGQKGEKPLEDGTVRFDLTPVPGCGADALASIPEQVPIELAAQATPVREAAQALATKAGFTLVNADALSERATSFKFDKMSPVSAMQLLADVDGKRAVFNGRSVHFEPK